MGKELTPGTVPAPLRMTPYNTIAFPRALREAIPDLHGGRVLKLDEVSGGISRAEFFEDHIQLNFTARETGKLEGEYVVRVDLLVDAARELGETLLRLVERTRRRRGRMNRREFLQGAALGGAALAIPADAADAAAPADEWFDRPMRWAQLTLAENDPGTYDRISGSTISAARIPTPPA